MRGGFDPYPGHVVQFRNTLGKDRSMKKITENQRTLIMNAGYTPELDAGKPAVTCSLSRGTGDIWSDVYLCGNWESLAYRTNSYELCGCGRHER